MPIVVDAYNVVHVTGVLPPDLAGMEVPELVRVIPRTRFSAEQVTLVCDGKPAPGVHATAGSGRVRVRYAGGGKSADDLIAAMVERSSAPRRLTVVSSDREVQRSARRRRCAVLTSEEFLQRIADDLHGESLDRMEAEAEQAQALEAARAPKQKSKPSSKPKPPADPLFPADLLREAAMFSLPPEETDDAESGAESPKPEPVPDPDPTPAPAPAPAEPAEPILPAGLLAEALDLARDDHDRRRDETARRRAKHAADAARRSQDAETAARLAAERAAHDAAALARRTARDERLAGEAASAIGADDLAALDALLDRAVPPADRPKKDETFDDDIVAEAERMLREFGDEPRSS